MKRILIYFFFDVDGIVDRYVPYLLKRIVPFCERILIVSNGKLTNEGRTLLHDITPEVLERKNEGFDVWAYKDAMDFVGWENLIEYDELILMNYTIMGPVYPLSEMFDAMDKHPELEFWGVTKCFRVDSAKAQEKWRCPYGYSPEHIQSSFTAFRKSLVMSNVFQTYWKELPAIRSYNESGGRHEQFITKYFEDNGFRWDCYTDFRELHTGYYGDAPLITMPLDVIRDLRSPFFKRRSFFLTRKELPLPIPAMYELVEYLKSETDFDLSVLYENLIRTCNQRDLLSSLLPVHIVE